MQKNIIKKAYQRAFSLVELLTVIVIVGILAVIAIPAYKDYVIKAKFAELIIAAEPYKLETAKAFYATDLAPVDRIDVINGKLIRQIQLWRYSTAIEVIHLQPQNFYPEWTSNHSLLLIGEQQNGAVVWNCYRHPSAAIPAKYLPDNCQNLAPF